MKMLSRAALSINYRVIPSAVANSQKVCNRSIHVSCRISTTVLNRSSHLKLSRYSPIISSSFPRYINTGTPKTESIESILGVEPAAKAGEDLTESLVQNAAQNIAQSVTQNLTETSPQNVASAVEAASAQGITASTLENIPDAPLPPPVSTTDVVEALNALGEPTFASLGLATWSPAGMLRQLFEWVHVGLDIPWWGTIVIGTICVRTLMFPLIVMAQRNSARMHNTMPGMQKIQMKITEARSTGDQLAAAEQTKKLMDYMSKHDTNPLKNVIPPLCQAPVFLSFFWALKSMADLPVESMRHGGMLWFPDLTIPDPYWLLPIITSASLAGTIKLGVDAPNMATMGIMKYIIQALPLFIIPFSCSFPSAITLYWTATNVFSMIQVGFLKIPAIRTALKIPQLIKHDPVALPPKKKFTEGFKESWTNMKLAREMSDREQLDNVQFNKAGRGPIQKTYAYNPITEHLKKTERQRTEVFAKKR